MSADPSAERHAWQGARPSGRVIGGLVVVLVLAVWILSNHQSVQVSLVFTSVTMPLWGALLAAALLGAAAGFLGGRRRYHRRR